MIEAKGPGYASCSNPNIFPIRFCQSVGDGRPDESPSGGTRDLDWFFAEEAAASKARQVFGKAGFGKINVIIVPAVIP